LPVAESVNVKLPADPARQPSIEFPALSDVLVVWVVCVVVVDVELSGDWLVDGVWLDGVWLEGEVLEGELLCGIVLLGLLLEGEVLEGELLCGIVLLGLLLEGELVVVLDCELCVCELLVSGVVDCDELLCATTHTEDSNRIAVIR
jgi:hypothetical protein